MCEGPRERARRAREGVPLAKDRLLGGVPAVAELPQIVDLITSGAGR
jgi:hypothetical protein